MRQVARALLWLFAFTVPWEYSLVFEAPFGNIARLVGLALVLATVIALVSAGHMRAPNRMQWAAAALFLWYCCTCFWSIDPALSFRQLPGFAQELMIVWLVAELVEEHTHWILVLQAYVAGCCVLAALTIANFLFSANPDQIRFVAHGQDPNDTARYLVLGLSLATLNAVLPHRRVLRVLAAGSLPLCTVAVLLTASRSGFVVMVVALAGCAVMLVQMKRSIAVPALLAAPMLIAAARRVLPADTVARIASLSELLHGGDLNQRLNIWAAGWHAFARAPFYGAGAGTFVLTAGLAPEDTAHNTALALAVEDGIFGLLVFSLVVCLGWVCILRAKGAIRTALATDMLVLLLCCLGATVQESRATWLLFGLMAVAPGVAEERPEPLLQSAVPLASARSIAPASGEVS